MSDSVKASEIEKENQNSSYLPISLQLKAKHNLHSKPRIPLVDVNTKCTLSNNDNVKSQPVVSKLKKTSSFKQKTGTQLPKWIKPKYSDTQKDCTKSGVVTNKPHQQHDPLKRKHIHSKIPSKMERPLSTSPEELGQSEESENISAKQISDSSADASLIQDTLSELTITCAKISDECSSESSVLPDECSSNDLYSQGITCVETVVTPIKFVPTKMNGRGLSAETMTNSCNGTSPVVQVNQETSMHVPVLTDSAVGTSPCVSHMIKIDLSSGEPMKIQKHIESLSISNELLRSELDRHKRDSVLKDEQIFQLREENTAKIRKLSFLQKQSESLIEKTKCTLQSDIDSYQQQITFLQNELSITQEELQSQQSKYEAKIEKLEKDFVNLEEDLCRVYRNHKDELAEIHEEYARNDYRPHFEKSQLKIAELEEELRVYNNLASAIEKASILQDKVENDFDERHRRIKEQTELLQLQQGHYETQYKEFTKQKVENEEFVHQAKEESELLRVAHKQMSEELERYKKQAQQFNWNQVQMVESNEFLDAENRMLQESLQEVERGCNNTQLELARCNAIIANKTLECTNLENMVKDLREKLTETMNELETTKVNVSFLYQYVNQLYEKASIKANALQVEIHVNEPSETVSAPPKSTGKSFVSAVLTAQTCHPSPSQCSDNDEWHSLRDLKTLETSIDTMHTADDHVLAEDNDPEATLFNISGVGSIEDSDLVEEEFNNDHRILDEIQSSATTVNTKRESAFMVVQKRSSVLNPVQGSMPSSNSENTDQDLKYTDDVEEVHNMVKSLVFIIQQCDKARVEDIHYLQNERDQLTYELETYKKEQTYIMNELKDKLSMMEKSAIDAGVQLLQTETAHEKSKQLLTQSESKIKELQGKLESILEQDFTINKLRRSLESFVEENKQLAADKEFAESALNDLVTSTKDGNPESHVVELIQLKKELKRSRVRYYEQEDMHKETVTKAQRRMKTLEENWQKAEAEVSRLDLYITEIKQTLAKNKSIIESCDELLKLLNEM
ncbi:uncharacterized protein LOC141899123 [Tubulanus polymorphus]|uniref:uncharacterized protein LOC141899123 n=1 Tax=Tubulanus polymorphus TaxID=672921 RepID=UPI003DA3DA81